MFKVRFNEDFDLFEVDLDCGDDEYDYLLLLQAMLMSCDTSSDRFVEAVDNVIANTVRVLYEEGAIDRKANMILFTDSVLSYDMLSNMYDSVVDLIGIKGMRKLIKKHTKKEVK